MKLAVLGSLVGLLLAQPAGAAELVKMGDLPAISSAGLYVAMEKGFFAEKNITVETERFSSGAKMTPALATGQLDVSTGTPSASLFNAMASGQDFKIVADKGQVRPGSSFIPLIVRNDLIDSGKVKRVRDLKGMKIANGAKGIILDYVLARLLESDGLSYDAVEIVNLAYPDAIKALATKAVDAAIAPEPWGVRAEEQKVGKRLFLSELVPDIATFQIAVVMYSGKFIKERPKVARDFIAAYVKGVRFYSERGPKNEEIARIVSKHTGVPPEAIKTAIPFYIDPDAKPRVQDLATLQAWFHKMGWVKEMVSMERAVDLTFLP
jgi:NitT/TauT family transport system substrate-binding protein